MYCYLTDDPCQAVAPVAYFFCHQWLTLVMNPAASSHFLARSAPLCYMQGARTAASTRALEPEGGASGAGEAICRYVREQHVRPPCLHLLQTQHCRLYHSCAGCMLRGFLNATLQAVYHTQAACAETPL